FDRCNVLIHGKMNLNNIHFRHHGRAPAQFVGCLRASHEMSCSLTARTFSVPSALRECFSHRMGGFARLRHRHHDNFSPRWKKPPLGPSSATVASSTAVSAPSSTVREPVGFMSVFTLPGCAEFTFIREPRSTLA